LGDVDEAIGPKETVVPGSKRGKDGVEVSDEFSVSEPCEVQLGVEGYNLLLNSCEERAAREAKSRLQQLRKVLSVSVQPCAKIFQLDEEILPPFSPRYVKLLPNFSGNIKWDRAISSVGAQRASVTIVVHQG